MLPYETPEPSSARKSWKFLVLGIDEHFTFADKAQTWAIFAWTMLWFAVFVVLTAWNLIWGWPTSWWATYWHVVGIWFPLVVGVITTTWFTIGGLKDLRVLFKRLDAQQRAKQGLSSDAAAVSAQTLDATEVGGDVEVLVVVEELAARSEARLRPVFAAHVD